MKRREFAGLLAAPAVLGAAKSGKRLPVVGQGEHTYEVMHDWGELPAGLAYGNTHGVTADGEDRIYVNHTVHASSARAETLVVFDKKGKFLRGWGAEFRGGAHGLHWRREGREEFLYFTDTGKGRPSNAVDPKHTWTVKMTMRGEEVFRIGYPSESPGYAKKPVYSPTNVAIAPNGDLFIADGYGASFVNQYDAGGKFIRSIGGTGKEPGQFLKPHGIHIDTRQGEPRLLVADRSNNRLQYFDLEGRFQKVVQGPDINLPCHFQERGGVLLMPDLGARVTLLDRDDKLIAHLGDDSASDWRNVRTRARSAFTAGKFVSPHSACFNSRGDIFVVEWVEVGRVTKLRKTGG